MIDTSSNNQMTCKIHDLKQENIQLEQISLNEQWICPLCYENSNNIKTKEQPNEILDNTNKIQYNQEKILQQQQLPKIFQFQLLTQTFVKQENDCWAIAFNKNNSIMAAGCGELIKMFQFQNEQLLEIQTLKGHKWNILCLQFMQKDNQLVSGSGDTTIKIWQQINQNEWKNIQTLNGHYNWISCLIINMNDDQIISGSNGQSILFWKLNQDQWALNQQIKCSSSIYSLSLNNENTKLISSEENKLISVFVYQENEWKIIQKINVETEGLRLSFISDNEFVFLPWLGSQIQFYSFNQQNEEFQINYEIQVTKSNQDYQYFPIIYDKSNQNLIVKNGKYINVLQKQGNNQFILEQSIELNHPGLYGTVSNDGQVLIVWSKYSQEYQIWKLEQIIQ